MKKDEILNRIKAIKDAVNDYDDERAHAREDELMIFFIKGVAKRKDSLGKLARLVLSTRKIEISRWCA